MSGSGFPRLRPVAEHGLLVEFGDTIAADIHARVLSLDTAIAADPFPGFREAVPAYASLLVLFDPLATSHIAVARALRERLAKAGGTARDPALRTVAVCYDADLAPDLAHVAAARGMAPEAVIAAHLSGDYRVYMYGFAPGYAYLGGVPETLHLPRKPAPLRGVPAGSVLIAGAQCIVSTLVMPTGWWIIGRSPTPILTGDADRPFLFDIGDRVRFQRLSRAAFEAAG